MQVRAFERYIPLMQVKSIVEHSHSAVLLTCIKLPHDFNIFVCLFLSGRLRQVSLYIYVFLVEDLTDIPNQFTQERATFPLMFLSTPLDKYSSHWTRDSPTAPILQRLVLLAQKSLQVIEGLIIMGTIPDFKVWYLLSFT